MVVLHNPRKKRKTTLTVITAYRVCKTHGAKTAYSQQQSLQMQRGIENPDPRKQCLKDLKEFINERRAGPLHSIIVMMDANENIMDRNSQIAAFIQQTGLVDVHGMKHGYDNDPATHHTGSRRIDYILVSPALIKFIPAAGIEPFGTGKPSTHRSMFFWYLPGSIPPGRSTTPILPPSALLAMLPAR